MNLVKSPLIKFNILLLIAVMLFSLMSITSYGDSNLSLDTPKVYNQPTPITTDTIIEIEIENTPVPTINYSKLVDTPCTLLLDIAEAFVNTRMVFVGWFVITSISCILIVIANKITYMLTQN